MSRKITQGTEPSFLLRRWLPQKRVAGLISYPQPNLTRKKRIQGTETSKGGRPQKGSFRSGGVADPPGEAAIICPNKMSSKHIKSYVDIVQTTCFKSCHPSVHRHTFQPTASPSLFHFAHVNEVIRFSVHLSAWVVGPARCLKPVFPLFPTPHQT